MPRTGANRRSMSDSDLRKVGKRLKEARKKAGLTQKQAGIAANVSGSAVVYYECGHMLPTIGRLVRLCRAYGISIDGLVEGLEL